DSAAFADFTPERPDTPKLDAPASGAPGVATNIALRWQRAPFATSYDVYLGTTSNNMTKVGNVPAALTHIPPLTMSFSPRALQSGTTGTRQVGVTPEASQARPSVKAEPSRWTFATGGGGPPGPPAARSCPSPADGATGVGVAPTLAWS